MNRIIFVVFCLLVTNVSFADTMNDALTDLESRWARVSNSTAPEEVRKRKLRRLFDKVTALANRHPNKAEPKIVQACILLSIAEIDSAISALSLVKEAKGLLMTAISINPDARRGSAIFTLGILYYKVPGWPVGFGDDKKAEQLLLASLNRAPDAIDSNYFYGEFLLQQDRPKEAKKYLRKAVQARYSQDDPFQIKIQKQAFAALAKLI